MGIGLPKFFIEVQYKWYVLPVVLSIFLIFMPCFFLQWSNRNRAVDSNGVSIRSYSKLFMCIEVPPNKYTALTYISSFVEFYEHPLIKPISTQDRQLLEAELTRNPIARRPVLEHFNDRQLQVFWEIYRYSSGMGDFSHPEFLEIL